jgi:hypothetical protein
VVAEDLVECHGALLFRLGPIEVTASWCYGRQRHSVSTAHNHGFRALRKQTVEQFLVEQLDA